MKKELCIYKCPDYYTLPVNNPIGNTNRFVDTDGYLIDYLTRVAYINIMLGASAWTDAIEAADASNAHGYNDWYLPNEETLATLRGIEPTRTPFNFSLIESGPIWTSTTCRQNVTKARVLKTNLRFGDEPKTNYCNYLMCRNIDEVKSDKPKIKVMAWAGDTIYIAWGSKDFSERMKTAQKLQDALNELIK